MPSPDKRGIPIMFTQQRTHKFMTLAIALLLALSPAAYGGQDNQQKEMTKEQEEAQKQQEKEARKREKEARKHQKEETPPVEAKKEEQPKEPKQPKEAKAESKKDVMPTGTPVLWKDPGDISARDLFLGPGGEEMKPDLKSVTFIERETGGFSVKYRVRDGAGKIWVVKVGSEAQPETASLRLVSAMGYVSEIN